MSHNCSNTEPFGCTKRLSLEKHVVGHLILWADFAAVLLAES